MDNQVIQELEIIIKTQVEQARKEIKSFKKEASGYAKDISKEMNKGFESTNFGETFKSMSPEITKVRDRIIELKSVIGWFSKQKEISLFQQDKLKEYKKELENLMEIANDFNSRVVKVTEVSGGKTIKYDMDYESGKIVSDIEKIQHIYDENPIEIPTILENPVQDTPINNINKPLQNNTASSSSEPLVADKESVSNIDKIRNALKEAHEEMKKIRDEAGISESLGLNPYEVMSYGDSFKLLASDIGQTFPVIAEFKQMVEQNLNGDFGDSLLQKGAGAFLTLKNNASEAINAVKEKFNDFKSSASSAFGSVKETIGGKLSPIIGQFKNIKNYATGTFNKIKNDMKTMVDNTPLNKLKGIIDKLKEVKNESKKVKSSGKNIGSGFKSFANDIGKGFTNGIKSIKKFTLSLLSIRTAFSAISKASQAYLSFDETLSNAVQNCWNVLGSLLAPIIEYIVNLFTKLVSVIASFVKALSGVDLVARANAKALDKQSKSAKSASQSLAGIDDIDTLHSNNGSGGDSTPSLSTSNIDTGPIDEFAKKIKDLFSTIFEPMKNAWETTGPKVIDSIKQSFESIKTTIGDVANSWLSVWTNGTGEELCNNMLIIISQIFDFVTGLSTAFDEAWNHAGAGTTFIQSSYDAVNNLFGAVEKINKSILDICNNGTLQKTFSYLINIFTNINKIFGQIFESIGNAWAEGDSGTKIFQNVADTINIVLDFIDDVTKSLLDWVISDGFQQALNAIFDVIEDISQIAKQFAEWVKSMYDKYIKPVIEDKLLPAIDEIITCIGDVWKAVKPVVDKIIKTIENYLEPIIKDLAKLIGGLIDIIRGIAQFISGVFTGDWKKAWNGIKKITSGVWDSIKSTTKAVWDSIWGVIKGVINTIIWGMEKMVNVVIKGLNAILTPLRKVGNAILKAVGIESFSFTKIPDVSLPRLAKGNVATKPTKAIFGEYANARSNPEITSPVSLMKESFRDVLDGYELGGTRFDTLKIDVAGKNFYDDTIDYINDKSERNGVSVIKEV